MQMSELSVSAPLQQALEQQRLAYHQHPVPDIDERRADLKALKRFVRDHRDALCDAINADYGHRSRHETLLAEVVPVITGIDHVLRHLSGWMRPQRRSIDLRSFFGARNSVVPQPLGVVGVIVPWNFPLNLSFVPLTYILAAGNRAMIKMSENSPRLGQLLAERMPAYLPHEKVRFFPETGGLGPAFSALPFDHLLFTGSGQTGRAVMASAARNLVPVTLELGGKSPAIVCEDFALQTAVERIMVVKCMNAGQICTTVDHVFVPEDSITAFVEHARSFVLKAYRELDSVDYTSIIDQKSYDRLVAALDEAAAAGARLVPLLPGAPFDPVNRRIAPHIVLDAPAEGALMQREIFGPILPVIGYRSLEQVITRVNQGPRPLAVYPFTHDGGLLKSILERVMSGGVSVNDALFHVAQHDLPFGGVGESGMGHYHGREGFETFSKLRPIFHQARFSSLKMLAPPYGRLADRVLNFLTR